MPIYTARAFDDPYTQADLPPTSASVRSATIDDAISNLITPSIGRFIELDRARSLTRLLPRQYDATQAEGFMEANGLAGQFKFEDRPYNQLELSILARRKQAELRRQSILARADNDLASGAGRLGLNLMTSLADPLTIASGFIPVVGEARYAQLLAKAGGALGRAGVRAGVGAAEGVVGSAVAEPIIAAAKSQEQADYELSDSLMNIAVGGVFGGGLHVVGGLAHDLATATRRQRVDARSAELQRVLAARAELDRPAPFTALDEVERPLRTEDVESSLANLYKSRRAELTQAAAAKLSRTDELALREELKTPDLAETRIAEINEKLRTHERADLAAGELRRLESAWSRADGAKDRAELLHGSDASVWQDLANAERADTLEAATSRIAALEAEREQVAGTLQAAEEAQAAASASPLADTAVELQRKAAREAHQRLRAIDGELFKLKPLAADLTEKLQSAPRLRVLRASPAAREAALRTSVAQAVSGAPINVEPHYAATVTPESVRAFAQPSPDQRPLSDPAAVDHADQVLAAGEQADSAAIEQATAALDEQLAAFGDELSEDVREQLKQIGQVATDAKTLSKAARLLSVCAMGRAA